MTITYSERVNQTGRLVVVCGLPGSGKTTLARRLATQYPGVVLSADDWMKADGTDLRDEAERARIEGVQGRLVPRLLALGATVIVEWGSWGRSERDALREQARRLGAAVELRFLDAPDEELFRRVAERAAEDPPLTAAEMIGYRAHLQVPTPEELALYDEPLIA